MPGEFDIDDLIGRRRSGFSLEQPFYLDARIFTRDCDELIFQQWLLVDHASRIPDIGDYFLFEIANESVIVVRSSANELRAFFNVCRHRGSRLCSARDGNAKAFRCPYHAWTYATDGKLLKPPLMSGDFDSADYSLHECHLRLFNGLIFVCLSRDNPPEFDAQYAEFDETLAFHGFADAKVVERRTYPNACNWKLVVENFLECYHCAPAHAEYSSVHPRNQLLAMGAGPGSGSEKAQQAYQPVIDEFDALARRLGHPTTVVDRDEASADMAQLSRLPINDKGFLSETEDGTPACAIPMGQFEECDGGLTAISFNPLGYILASNDFAMMARFTPRSAIETDIELCWLVDGKAKAGVDYDIERMTWLWDVTIKQDKLITETNHQGILSSRYQPGPYSQQEARVDTFIRWYLRNIASQST